MKNLLLLCFFVTSAPADVSLPAIFSDHAVLQRSKTVPVWGKAEPGENVTVTLDSVSAKAVTAADGRWRANLDLSAVGGGPFELVVQGNNRLVASDVLVGEVWLCSGQSNMEWPLRSSGGAAEEIKNSANSQLRHFKVKNAASAVPLDALAGKWVVATPATTPEFSAVGYYFGQALQRSLGRPVGLINASWGGTPVEAWTSVASLSADPELKAGSEKARLNAADYKKFLSEYHNWILQQKREDRAPDLAFNAEATAADGWTPVKLPGSLADTGLDDAGAVWIARKITLPAAAVGSGLQVFFGDVRDAVKIYWNGVPLGEGDIETTMHRYSLNARHVTTTEGVLTARIFRPSGAPAIAPGSARFRLDHKGGTIPLAGDWMAKREFALPPLATGIPPCPEKPPLPRSDNNVAGYLFDGMIRPLIPSALAGVIWYQGEHNWDRGWQYRTAFPLLIADWRREWGQGEFPFYYCQLANYQQVSAKPGDSLWAEVRDAQSAALSLPRTGMAVLIDAGEAANIHPSDKRSPGERLAGLALAGTYGKEPIATGPVFESGQVEGSAIRIRFGSVGSGLVAKPVTPGAARPESEVQGFMICGADRKWVWAQAKIEGASVVVSAPGVSAPVAVRYAWADNPVCNLYNDSGLPAGPFRTDDFPMISEKNKY
jgi:sialate O-acetylesterase